MSGLKTLYNLLLKDAVKRSGQASGIMSIGDSVRNLAEKRLQSFLLSAKKQGVDLDKLSEQELKYIIELNKPQKPKIISADSPEGKGITEALLGKRGQVIEGNFGKPFAKEAENKKNIAAMKKRKMIEDAVDNASPGFVKGDRKYNAQLVAEDLADKKFGKDFYDLDQKQQMDLYDDALEGLSEQTRGMPDPENFATGGRAGYKFGIGPLIELLSKTSPKQAYTKYLKSVKDRAQKGDMKSLAPELGAISATGIFVNRRMKDVLENMKNQDIENNLENFKKELDADPFYKEYPELKDKMIEGYTEMMFGEKRADGGRAGFSEGNGVADEDAKNARFARRVRELMDEGFDMGEAVREAMKEGYAKGGIARIGLKDGMNRRTFMKIFSGLVALPIIGKVLKPLKIGKTMTKVPIIKTADVTGKPEWFDQLVNKVILEGDDMTKQFATKEREIVHATKIGKDDYVRVTQDLDEGSVRVEYDSPDNVFEDTVQMQYKKPLPDEGDPRPTAEFTTAESGPVSRRTGPDDYDIDVDEVGGSSISDLDSDVSKLKEYATGQKPTMKELVQNIKRKDRAKQITEDPEAQSDAMIRRQGDYDPSDYDDYASGGIARMLGE